MAVSRQQKEEILQKLMNQFSRSQSVVFAEYRGLSVAKLSELRSKLREKNSEMTVAKKTLINLAAEKTDLGSIDPGFMQGPVAATFSYEDALAGIKVLFQFSKENEKLKLLGGVIDGKVVSPETIAQYAQLPSKEELLAKLLGSMNAPVSGMVGVMNNLVAGLVRVLNAYKDKLPTSASVSTAAVQESTAPAVDSSSSEEKTQAPAEEKAEVSAEPAEPVSSESTDTPTV